MPLVFFLNKLVIMCRRKCEYKKLKGADMVLLTLCIMQSPNNRLSNYASAMEVTVQSSSEIIYRITLTTSMHFYQVDDFYSNKLYLKIIQTLLAAVTCQKMPVTRIYTILFALSQLFSLHRC